ncbi:MAG: DeoR/GlpR transcriptional regulator [Phycisphaerales bacterium]|nr:DeoR/GlpR transcriptional regulator [Phycisphaerales bacterium]
MSMATAQRRDRILTGLVDKTHLAVRDLSALLAVSEATIRRDLRSLADEGKLTLRPWGGHPHPGVRFFL